MWYLLTTPLKKLKKALNKWYSLCKVFGRRFDEVKEDILRARDEGMVATCSHEMLPVHGADRRLTRYEGEHPENYRSRIAMYEEVCIRGGTNEGMMTAIRTLGFIEVNIKTAKELKNDQTRWAEFYIILLMKTDFVFPISLNLLKKEVRKVKEVGAKDNYLVIVKDRACIKNIAKLQRCRISLKLYMYMYCNSIWNGTYKWNGNIQWNNMSSNPVMHMVINIQFYIISRNPSGIVRKYHYHTWNGTNKWDGNKNWDAEISKEEI